MTEEQDEQQEKRRLVAKAWRNWAIWFVPLLAAATIAMEFLGFELVIVILLVVLAATLLHQRFVKGRSWRSIMWGAHARED